MRIFFGIFAVAILVSLGFLGVRLKEAHDESEYWKTREATLKHELQELRKEVEEHSAVLDRLRRDPDFQDATARKELGYGKPGELNFRFPEKQKEVRAGDANP